MGTERDAENLIPFSGIFFPSVFWYITQSLSSTESSWSCREVGEKEKESAGLDGKGKERRVEEGFFPVAIVPARFLFFSITAIFTGIPSGSLCGGVE